MTSEAISLGFPSDCDVALALDEAVEVSCRVESYQLEAAQARQSVYARARLGRINQYTPIHENSHICVKGGGRIDWQFLSQSPGGVGSRGNGGAADAGLISFKKPKNTITVRHNLHVFAIYLPT